MPVEHFKNKEAERKNLAWRHIHGVPYTATTACVAGKCHKVKHSKSKSRRRIDEKQKLKKRKLGASRTRKHSRKKTSARKRA